MKTIHKPIGRIILARTVDGVYSVRRKTKYGELYHTFKPGAPSTLDRACSYVNATTHNKNQVMAYLRLLEKEL